MKTKIRLLGVAAVLVALVLVGWTFANNTFVESPAMGTLDISTMELAAGGFQEIVLEGQMPGAQIEVPKSITNDGDYSFYTRVTIYRYWEDGLNDQLDPSLIGLYAQSGESSIELTAGAEIGNGWSVWHAEEEQIILYYARPVAPGESTANVMDRLQIGTSTRDGYRINDHQNKTIHVAFYADAVQASQDAAVNRSAMMATWGVIPDFDGAGNIISITE